MVHWLRLVRLPNLATAAADALAGFLVCAGLTAVDWPPPACWLAVLASLCFYAAGMVLNDVYDVAIDRIERPERPLPSGTITVGRAAAVGNLLMAIGAAAACGAAVVANTPWPAFVGAALTATIWLYDRHAKKTAAGPVVMGSCRGLNWLLGMTAAGGPSGTHEWVIPLGMAVYVAGITCYARDEAGRSRAATLGAGAVLMLAGLAVAAGYVWLPFREGIGLAGTRIPATTWLVLWGILAGSVVVRALVGIADPSPGRVRAAVGNAIMSIITFDAVLVLAACGESWAVVVLLLLAFFLLGRRLVSPT
ncbi:MAG: UbiA family prenyltransferase [Planctomycetia bacterium]|nr:UbiA family prenyltransferase [Planctomycetia bacterium]